MFSVSVAAKMMFWRRITKLNFSQLAPCNGKSGYFLNPCLRLRQYLEIPLFENSEVPFEPSIKDLLKAEELFVPKPSHNISMIVRTIDPSKYPSNDLPEVAMIGQSNVGKSSLLKAIFKEVPETRIRTSKKPGSTKGAFFFQVGSKFCLVDMPGYGISQPAWFKEVVESYFGRRKNLSRVFFLIDSCKGFQQQDIIALELLEKHHVPYVIVMTKIDTATDSLLLRHLIHLKRIKEDFASICCFSQIFMVSAKTLEGLAYLQAYIAYITGNLSLEQNNTSR